MATIPLFNNGGALPVPAAEGLSRVPTARMQLDYGGLAQTAAKAYQQPLMPKDMYEGDRVAGEAWGQALQTLGKTMKVVFEETAKIKNEGDIADADVKMTESLGAYENGLTGDTSEDSWVSGWEKEVAGLRKGFESDRSLSPYAKHHIGMRLQRMEVAGKIRISSLAMTQQRQRASMSLDNLERVHREQGNFAGMRSVNERRTEVKLQTPEQAQARGDAIDAMERGDGLYKVIDANPKSGREQLDMRGADGKYVHFPWLDTRGREKARSYADQALQDRRIHIIEDVVEYVTSNNGQPIHPDDIDAFDPNRYLSTEQRADVQAYIAGNVSTNRKLTYEQAVTTIDAYRANDDPDQRLSAAMETTIGLTFEGPQKERLLSRLKERKKAASVNDPLPMGTVTGLLQHYVEDLKVFGEYLKPKVDARGQRILIKDPERYEEKDSGTFNQMLFTISGGRIGSMTYHEEAPESYSYEMEVDKVREAQLADKREAIRSTLEREKQAGLFKTTDEMVARLLVLIGQHGGKLPATYRQSGAPVSHGGGMVPNLPNVNAGPGDMSAGNPLLPPLTPQEATTKLNSILSK
ncbi:hypothetical protein DES53_115152 [Roseimicrobium gellanilyticum]|uniref:Uncharacterized protein n=1 Tax=Roseimicrobium gellanilyticum TaxID=748857 RepID=A0A366H6C6_9BACT|nr:hypothetical protein [Roseimicrobium gellanilyticum]RBP37011.1 hypothetical protein DES53_115152 [Roseimicrobium gellanilyticum]